MEAEMWHKAYEMVEDIEISLDDCRDVIFDYLEKHRRIFPDGHILLRDFVAHVKSIDAFIAAMRPTFEKKRRRLVTLCLCEYARNGLEDLRKDLKGAVNELRERSIDDVDRWLKRKRRIQTNMLEWLEENERSVLSHYRFTRERLNNFKEFATSLKHVLNSYE
jgi:hypothetical protein